MLILTRRVGESIVVGNDVVVTVLSVRGNQIRLGIQAPMGIRVDRQEIRKRLDDHTPQDSTSKNAYSP